jgi:hypothetical protein
MKLFHVSQDVNNDYDTYSDFVIACKDEETARWTHPHEYVEKWDGIICSSFHAG